MKGVAILGSTGSIGQSALAVVDAHPDKLRVVALAAGGNRVRFDESFTPALRFSSDSNRSPTIPSNSIAAPSSASIHTGELNT